MDQNEYQQRVNPIKALVIGSLSMFAIIPLLIMLAVFGLIVYAFI